MEITRIPEEIIGRFERPVGVVLEITPDDVKSEKSKRKDKKLRGPRTEGLYLAKITGQAYPTKLRKMTPEELDSLSDTMTLVGCGSRRMLWPDEDPLDSENVGLAADVTFYACATHRGEKDRYLDLYWFQCNLRGRWHQCLSNRLSEQSVVTPRPEHMFTGLFYAGYYSKEAQKGLKAGDFTDGSPDHENRHRLIQVGVRIYRDKRVARLYCRIQEKPDWKLYVCRPEGGSYLDDCMPLVEKLTPGELRKRSGRLLPGRWHSDTSLPRKVGDIFAKRLAPASRWGWLNWYWGYSDILFSPRSRKDIDHIFPKDSRARQIRVWGRGTPEPAAINCMDALESFLRQPIPASPNAASSSIADTVVVPLLDDLDYDVTKLVRLRNSDGWSAECHQWADDEDVQAGTACLPRPNAERFLHTEGHPYDKGAFQLVIKRVGDCLLVYDIPTVGWRCRRGIFAIHLPTGKKYSFNSDHERQPYTPLEALSSGEPFLALGDIEEIFSGTILEPVAAIAKADPRNNPLRPALDDHFGIIPHPYTVEQTFRSKVAARYLRDNPLQVVSQEFIRLLLHPTPMTSLALEQKLFGIARSLNGDGLEIMMGGVQGNNYSRYSRFSGIATLDLMKPNLSSAMGLSGWQIREVNRVLDSAYFDGVDLSSSCSANKLATELGISDIKGLSQEAFSSLMELACRRTSITTVGTIRCASGLCPEKACNYGTCWGIEEKYPREINGYRNMSPTQRIRLWLRYVGENETWYSDYLMQLGVLKGELDDPPLDRAKFCLFPKKEDVKRLHDELTVKVAEARANKDKAEYDNLNKRYLEGPYKKARKLEYKTEDYVMLAPTHVCDLDIEGAVLHHCVGSYKHSVAEGKEYILFLRHADDQDAPFFTVDVMPDGQVRQIHCTHNGDISGHAEQDALVAFLMKWADEKKGLVDKSSLVTNYGALCAMR